MHEEEEGRGRGRVQYRWADGQNSRLTVAIDLWCRKGREGKGELREERVGFLSVRVWFVYCTDCTE